MGADVPAGVHLLAIVECSQMALAAGRIETVLITNNIMSINYAIDEFVLVA